MDDRKLTIEDLLSHPSFVRWTEGEADKAEALMWDEWCRMSNFNKELALRAQAQMLDLALIRHDSITTEQKWQRLHHSIDSRQSSGLPVTGRKKTEMWWYRIAAMIIVSIATGLITYYTVIQKQREVKAAKVVWQHVETDYAEHKKITLSDGSYIILGANSSLSYPEGWISSNSIEVQLYGEAYFSIAKRDGVKEPAFKVKTSDGTVEVLGTRFTVNKEKSGTRVVLEEGAVKITGVVPDQADKNYVVRLKPNEMVNFSRSNSNIDVQQVNPKIYTSWTKNILTLDNTSFLFLADRIKKTFGVKVRVNNPRLYTRRLTGTLDIKSLDQLVNAIVEVLEIKVRKENGVIIFG